MPEQCEEVQARLYELLSFVPGEGADPELLELRRHLARCPECKAERDELRGFLATSREAVSLLPDEATLARLAERTRTDSQQFLAWVREQEQATVSDQAAPLVAEPPVIAVLVARLGTLTSPERLRMLKAALIDVVRAAVPRERAMVDLLWQAALVARGQQTGGRAASPGLGAISGREQTLRTTTLLQMVFWLDDQAAAPPAAGVAGELPADELTEQLLQAVARQLDAA